MFLKKSNKLFTENFFKKIIELGINFKNQKNIRKKFLNEKKIKYLYQNIPSKGEDIDLVLNEFKRDYLPYCTNFGSENFLGFPDAGNSVAGIGGAILSEFLQQNLINQSFCSPSGTIMEINVIQWLREIVGYKVYPINNNLDVGGIVTFGGTISNIIGILLARENKYPGCINNGIYGSKKGLLIVPKGIGHYSVKSAQMLLGLGNNLLEVDTNGYKYDLKKLKETIINNKGNVFGLVAYAGDSRTMSIDNFEEIYKMVKKIDSSIWLHADACHGFSLGCSEKLKYKIKGIEKFDSISGDPHKVFNLPYTISMLLVKEPKSISNVLTVSDLIMNEGLDLGQITPFIGSKPWLSLKLWFLIKNLGLSGLSKLIYNRHKIASDFAKKVSNNKAFILINTPEINSVMFMYVGSIPKSNIEKLNFINKQIYNKILLDGKYYIHNFPIHDDSGIIKKGAKIFPLRFMSGNPNLKMKTLDNFLKYLEEIGNSLDNNN